MGENCFLLSHQGVKWEVEVDLKMLREHYCKVTRMAISYLLGLPGASVLY